MATCNLVRRCWTMMHCQTSPCAYYKHQHPRRWVLATILICLYGFFKSMRPSEPFLTPYLIDVKNISEKDLNNVVYPYWTYSYMIALVPVFLFTDILRYKAVVVFEGLAYIGTWALLLWGEGVPQMILMQCVYGLATATEIAYYSYIFAAVPNEQFQQVSSYTRSALLTGNFIAGALGQLLISVKATSYFGLNVISMITVCCSLVVALALPTVRQTLYFHRSDKKDDGNGSSNCASSEESRKDDTGSLESASTFEPSAIEADAHPSLYHTGDHLAPQSINSQPQNVKGRLAQHFISCRDNFMHLWEDFKSCYGNYHLLKWSLWWAFATCGNFQVGNYIQNLWEIIYEKASNSSLETDDLYNGAVEAVSTLTGALCAFLIMFLHIDWRLFGELLLGVVSVIQAGLLVVMGTTSNIWLCYVFYIIFRSSYQLVITIATYQIAKNLALERYALVFGLNMFLASALGSAFTFVVVDSRTLDTPADIQFIIYGGYFFILACAFCVKAVYSISKYGWKAAWRERLEVRSTDQTHRRPVVIDDGDPPVPNYQRFCNDSDTGGSDHV